MDKADRGQPMGQGLLVILVFAGASAGFARADGADTIESLLPAIIDAHFTSVPPEALATLGYSEEVIVHAAWQSRRPDPPWDRSRGDRSYAIGFDPRRFAGQIRIREAGGYDFHYRVALDSKFGFLASFIDGYRRTLDPEAEWSARTADVFRRTPAWIVRELATAKGAQVEPGGRVIRFDSSAGRLTPAFDDTLLLRRSRWQDGAATGEFRFDEYRRQRGIAVPGKITLYWRGERVNDIRVTDALVNEPIEDLFRAPSDLPILDMPDAAAAREFSVREIADGTWLIGEGMRYQLFVEFEDHVVGLGSVGGVDKRLAALRERIGGKPLRYALVTHHHSDHLEGVRALVEAGATLLVTPAHEAIVRKAAGDAQHPRLESVRGTKSLGRASRSIQIIDIGPNVHAEHMLVAWLPAQKILWSADMFVQPPERPVRTAIAPIRDLAGAIESHELDVQRLLDPHSPRINSIADLQKSLEKSRMAGGY